MAMLASRAWAVQMFDVAFSRRMLLACAQRQSECGTTPESFETPTRRPGIWRLKASWVAKNAAWGPPKPRGTRTAARCPRRRPLQNSPGGGSRSGPAGRPPRPPSLPRSWAAWREGRVVGHGSVGGGILHQRTEDAGGRHRRASVRPRPGCPVPWRGSGRCRDLGWQSSATKNTLPTVPAAPASPP